MTDIDVTQINPVLAEDAPLPMTTNTKLGLGVLGGALVMGIVGDLLLRASPWGLNLSLWVGTLVVAVAALVRWRGEPLRGDGRWLVIPLLFFAAAVAWRDSETLAGWDTLAILLCLAFAAFSLTKGKLQTTGMFEYGWAAMLSAIYALLGPLEVVVKHIAWKTIPRGRWGAAAVAVGRGLAIALPVLLIFGGLLVAADAVFENIVSNVLDFDAGELFVHVFLIGFFGWLTAGYLNQVMFNQDRNAETFSLSRPGFLKLGVIEVGVVLGLLNVLFLAFVLVQFRYFFGGAAVVEAQFGLNYAEYARRGFFELVTVATLLLPLLLGLHWMVGGDNAEGRVVPIYRGLALGLISMMGIMMVSALQRMALYVDVYGLTELRLYVTSFMIWLALVFVWFGLTVLRRQRYRFAWGALISGFITLGLLHAINPDALIVQTNVSRIGAPTVVESDSFRYESEFDDYYVLSLSADAVPTLVNLLPQIPEAQRCQIADRLLDDYYTPPLNDWRTWNWGEQQAWQAVAANRGTLEGMACSDTRIEN